MTQSIDDFGGYHPLFLPLDGQEEEFKPEEFRAIVVYRIDRGSVRVNKGSYTPAELLSEADIFARFGGGQYELVARRPNGTVYARRPYMFDGPPRDVVQPAQGAPQTAPTQALAPAVSGDRELALITLFMQIMQKSSDDTKQLLAAMMQSQQQSSAQSQQMMIALLSSQQNAGASSTQAMSSVLGQVLSTKLQPGADPVAMATKVIELSKAVGAEKAGTTDWTTIVQGVLAGLGMLAQMGQQSQQTPPQNGQPPPPQVVVDTTAQPANGAQQVPVS